MFSLTEAHRFYLYSGACDMRKGFDTLCGVVRLHMGRDPLSGEVFIFLNRVRSTVKLLHWEHGGLVIYHKRLEQGRFSPPRYDEKTGSMELKWVVIIPTKVSQCSGKVSHLLRDGKFATNIKKLFDISLSQRFTF